MATNKEIKLGIDTTPISKMREELSNLNRGVLDINRKITEEIQKQRKEYEEIVRLLKERNSLDQGFKPGGGGGAGANAGNTQMMNQMMFAFQNIISAINQTSKNEIRNARVIDQGNDIDRMIERRSGRAALALPPGPPQPPDIIDVDYEEIKPNQPEEQAKREEEVVKKRSRSSRRRTNLKNLVRAENEYQLLAEAIGGFTGALGSRMFTSATEFERQAIEAGRLNPYGRTASPLNFGRDIGRGLGFAPSNMGLSSSEALARMNMYERTLTRDVTRYEAGGMMGAERVLGIDANTIQNVLTSLRYDPRSGGATDVFGRFDRTITQMGRHVAVIPELINQFITTSDQILNVRNDYDSRAVADVISNLTTRGIEGRQQGRIMAGFQGLGQSGNPVVRAMMMRAAREINPNATFFDIQETMEGGMGTRQGREAIQRFVENLRQQVGGGDALRFALKSSMPGLSYQDVRKISEGDIAGVFRRRAGETAPEFAERATELVSPIDRSAKQFATAFELAGDGVIDAIERLKAKLNDALEFFGVNIKGVNEKTEAEKEHEKMVNKIAVQSMQRPI